MYKKILITGSAGFIGSEISNFLLMKKLEVFNLDIVAPKYENKCNFFRCNIMNKKKLLKIFKHIRPDIVIHLAAKTDMGGIKLIDYKVNFLGTKNIICASNSTTSVKRVVFASSLLVNKIGSNTSNFAFYNPDTNYGKSKVLMERIIKESKCNFSWCIIRPTTIWGDNIKNHFFLFLKLIEKRLYFNFGPENIYKSYGYIKNAAFQIYKLSFAQSNYFNNKTYYICDYSPINFKEWTNKISKRLSGKILLNLPLSIIKCFSKVGDFIVYLGFKNFLISSFRLNNILTDFRIETSKLEKICGKLPYNLDNGIKNFVSSYNFKNKRIFFTFGSFIHQKYGGISRQMYNLLSFSSKFNENISTSFKFHQNEYLKSNPNRFNQRLFFASIPKISLIFINLIYDLFYKTFFYKSIFHETLFYNFFKFSKKTKIIITIHDLIDEKFQNNSNNFLINLKIRIKIFLRKISIKNADYVICVSKNTKKDFLSFYGDYITSNKIVKVVYPGYFNESKFNLKLKKKNKSSKKKFILFVGNRDGYKNFYNFIQGFSKSKYNKKYYIYCFGGKKFSDFDKEYFNKYNLQNKIYQITGSDFTLAQLYKNAEFLIFPSIYEGFGVPPLEAMFLSCPVLASKSKSLDEALGNAALRFSPNKTTDIQHTIDYYIKNKKKLKPMLIKKGLERVKNFSWERMNKEIINIYKDLN